MMKIIAALFVFATTCLAAAADSSDVPLVSPASSKQTVKKPVKKSKPTVSALPKNLPPKLKPGLEKVEADAIARNISLIDFANDRLEYLRGDEIDCPQCFASGAGTGSSSLEAKDAGRVCKDKWTDFYSHEPVDVRIVFGYQDSDDDSLAGDVLQRQAMVDRITAKCAEDNLVQACDFVRSPDDADVFERDVRGPDAKMHKMRVRLTASSYSSSDAVNRSFTVEQEQKTQAATKVFYDGLKEADMLLYVGHARDGGGPDFKPARRNDKGKIDYPWYRDNTPGVDDLTKQLMSGDKTPKIMGFFACESERWRDRLNRYASKSGMILSATPKMPLEVGAAQAFAALDSAIWQRCGESFNKAINFAPEPGEEMKYGDRKLIPLSITNFFKK